MLGDKAYDSAELRVWLQDRGTKPVIPNRSNRKQPFSFNRRLWKERRRIENAFSRLKEFRRIATRYDRLARNFLASVCLAAALVWWIQWVRTLVSTSDLTECVKPCKNRRDRKFNRQAAHAITGRV
jgi:Transposase DDE domain